MSRTIQANLMTAGQKTKIWSYIEKGKENKPNMLDYSNTKVFFREYVSDEKIKRKKIVSGNSLIENVRNEQKYILKVKIN